MLPQSEDMKNAEEWLQKRGPEGSRGSERWSFLRFDLCSFFGGTSMAPPLTERRLRPDQELAS